MLGGRVLEPRRSCAIGAHFYHLLTIHRLAQTERPHIRPDLFYMIETLLLCSLYSDFAPAIRGVALGEPDRVLLFVIDHYFVSSIVVLLFGHFLSSHRTVKANRAWALAVETNCCRAEASGRLVRHEHQFQRPPCNYHGTKSPLSSRHG